MNTAVVPTEKKRRRNLQLIYDALSDAAREHGLSVDSLIHLLGISLPMYENIKKGVIDDKPEMRDSLCRLRYILNLKEVNPRYLTAMTDRDIMTWMDEHDSVILTIQEDLFARWIENRRYVITAKRGFAIIILLLGFLFLAYPFFTLISSIGGSQIPANTISLVSILSVIGIGCLLLNLMLWIETKGQYKQLNDISREETTKAIRRQTHDSTV